MRLWVFVVLIALSRLAIGAESVSHVDMVPRELWIPEKVSRLKVPSGYKLEVFASGLGNARGLAVGPSGEVYVSRPQQGDILVLKKEKDKVEKRTLFSGYPDVSGITTNKNRLYFIAVDKIYVANISDKKPSARVLYEGLPRAGQHPRRSLAVGPDGFLYVNVGSTCNACIEKNEESATILKAKLDGSERSIFARGIRNTIAFDWEPGTGNLYGVDHGFDLLGDDEPLEELNLIREGVSYGWPYCYGDRKPNPMLKNSDQASNCAKTEPPILQAAAHMAPIAMKFHWGTAFVTFHGSWNRSPPSGYKVQQIVFEKGKPAKFEDFVTGFLAADGKSQMGRPAGLAISKDGALLISDDANGVVYSVHRIGR